MRGVEVFVQTRPGLLDAFQSSHDRLFGYVARRVGPNAAEDVVAETFGRGGGEVRARRSLILAGR
jgi:DNA-directed RNA polymerase specialized sigma24 family protein